MQNVEIGAICDVYETVLKNGLAEVEKSDKKQQYNRLVPHGTKDLPPTKPSRRTGFINKLFRREYRKPFVVPERV